MLASDSGGGDPSALSDAVTVGLPPHQENLNLLILLYLPLNCLKRAE
jgi:hypothetical protein